MALVGFPFGAHCNIRMLLASYDNWSRCLAREDHPLSYSLIMAQRLVERNLEGLLRTEAYNYDFRVPMYHRVLAS